MKFKFKRDIEEMFILHSFFNPFENIPNLDTLCVTSKSMLIREFNAQSNPWSYIESVLSNKSWKVSCI
jgi:hypothetical protein